MLKSSNEPPVDFNSEESWATTRRYTSFLMPIPPSISYVLQLLRADYLASLQTGTVRVQSTTLSALHMIEISAKLKAPIYFAATELYPDRVDVLQEDDTVKALCDVLGPGLLGSVLALVYLHRRINKICADPQWETLSKEMVLNMELGFLVGSAVPKLGAADGVLAGGIRYAMLAPFLIATPEYFKRYRNLKHRRFDLQHEHKIWGCDHSQIAAFMLKELGFSLDLRANSHALRMFDDDEFCTLPPELANWRAVLRFIDTIKDNGDLASGARELSLTPEELQDVKTKTEALFKGNSSFTWMFKGSKTLDDTSGTPAKSEGALEQGELAEE